MEEEEERRQQRILENERQQMELIRELDMEELHIEIVDDDEEDDGDISSSDDRRFDITRGLVEGANSQERVNFNMNLASLHMYLGEVDDIRGRLAFLDGGAILNLPIFYLEGIVLFPEAVLPLVVSQYALKAAVERAIKQADAPYTIGVVGLQRNPHNGRYLFGKIGTTAEIRQYKRFDDGSLNVVARGQQRFRMRRRWIDVEGVPCAEIQIIQEDTPLRTPKDAFVQLASISNPRRQTVPTFEVPFSNSIVSDDDNDNDDDGWESESDISPYGGNSVSPDNYEKLNGSPESYRECIYQPRSRMVKLDLEQPGALCDKVKRRKGDYDKGRSAEESGHKSGKPGDSYALGFRRAFRAPMTFWPRWVYNLYDSYSLAQRAADMWKRIIGVPNIDDFINKPDILSFYIASRIPLSQSTRQELLEIDGVSYRLQREIKLLEQFNLVCCKNCRAVIAKRSDILVMSNDGPLNAYVNPHGFVHEITTFYNAKSLTLHGSPVKEHSWFPGYAWTITSCLMCESNMGWLFTATNKKLRPHYFWGIRSSQIADDAWQT